MRIVTLFAIPLIVVVMSFGQVGLLPNEDFTFKATSDGAKTQTEQRQLLLRATRTNVDVRGSAIISARNCLALYRDGQYAFEVQDQGMGAVTKVGRVFEGTISEPALQQIAAVIDSKEFRDLTTPLLDAGKARHHLEMLGLEIQRENGPQQLHFIDSDGQSSFTPSATVLND